MLSDGGPFPTSLRTAPRVSLGKSDAKHAAEILRGLLKHREHVSALLQRADHTLHDVTLAISLPDRQPLHHFLLFGLAKADPVVGTDILSGGAFPSE